MEDVVEEQKRMKRMLLWHWFYSTVKDDTKPMKMFEKMLLTNFKVIKIILIKEYKNTKILSVFVNGTKSNLLCNQINPTLS